MEISFIETKWTKEEVLDGFTVGKNGVTKIIEVMKNGQYCEIPYLEIYKGTDLYASFCRHDVKGVYYEEK